jgi:CBS domain-containing protein
MERKKLVTAPPETTVSQAAKLMAKRNVGAVMVVENEKLVGIFTERDAVFRVIARGRDMQTTLLADVMTAAPQTVDPDKSFGYALMMSARNALDPDMEEFVAESQRRKHIRSQVAQCK